MTKAEKLLDRIEVFDDSHEISEALREIAGDDLIGCYYEIEAAVHIDGLWKLTNELGRELRRMMKANQQAING